MENNRTVKPAVKPDNLLRDETGFLDRIVTSDVIELGLRDFADQVTLETLSKTLDVDHGTGGPGSSVSRKVC